jgi:hypothetical protein
VAGDENGRPKGEERGRDLTGDVLSDRWTPESADTDEQPAVLLDGDPHATATPGTGPGAPSGADVPVPPPGTEAGSMPWAGGNDAVPLWADETDAPVWSGETNAPAWSGETDVMPETGEMAAVPAIGDPAALTVAGDDGSDRTGEAEPRYLPLALGYEASEEGSARSGGFLGSGWTGEPDPDREVRRRGRILLVGAAAVVAVGVAGGWMLSGSSAGEPCGGTPCASVGELAPVTEPPGEREPTYGPPPTTESTPEATHSESATPEPAPDRPRATRTPAVRPTPTRAPSVKPTEERRPPQQRDEEVGSDPEERRTRSAESPSSAPTPGSPDPQPPAATATPPAQQPDQRPDGLLDWIFG